MGIKSSELCEACGVPDFVEHMFIHCSRLRGFWKDVFQMIVTFTNRRFPMTDTNILLGIKDNEIGAKNSEFTFSRQQQARTISEAHCGQVYV